MPKDPQKESSENDLLTVRQVADILQVCEHTIRRDKRLVPIKFNARRYRYRRSDVDAFIAYVTPRGK